MSAYVVDPSHIEYLAIHILRGHRRGDSSYLGELLEKYPSDAPFHILCDRLWRMNVAAVCQRYQHVQPSTYGTWADQSDQTINYVVPDYDPIQFVKSLRCYIYQCSEGSVPKRKLYKFLNKLADDMAYNIVSSLPDYQGAQWGAPPSKVTQQASSIDQ